MNVGVVGLGFVGLSMSCVFAKKGLNIHGVSTGCEWRIVLRFRQFPNAKCWQIFGLEAKTAQQHVDAGSPSIGEYWNTTGAFSLESLCFLDVNVRNFRNSLFEKPEN